ncbi:MAG: hypothetical protein ACI31S_00130, partial [Bacilli bacterium]
DYGREYTFTLYLWIDGTMGENPSDMTDQEYDFDISCSITGTENKVYPSTLVGKITKLYDESEKTVVTNNDIEYNYATSVSLMNDRLGGTTTSLDGGNIRYYGASPNNYIYFNCSDYSNQSDSTCEKWRIIGVFGDKVKIIRNESIGELAWDQDKNINLSLTTYDNDWSTASLKVLLNEKYYNGDTTGTVTYYSGSDGSSSASLDMSSIGIKNDTTRNMITNVTWNLGGWKSSAVYSNEMYEYERGTAVYEGNPTTWTGKIALMYLSDYGYAVDFNACTENLYNYNSSTCTSNNWLFNNSSKFLLIPSSTSSSTVWLCSSLGRCGGNYVYREYNIFPVVFLDSKLGVGSGTGLSTDPYRIIS